MRYSCRHCQRIDFVELTQALLASPGLVGPLTSLRNPVEEVPPSERGQAAWLPHIHRELGKVCWNKNLNFPVIATAIKRWLEWSISTA